MLLLIKYLLPEKVQGELILTTTLENKRSIRVRGTDSVLSSTTEPSPGPWLKISWASTLRAASWSGTARPPAPVLSSPSDLGSASSTWRSGGEEEGSCWAETPRASRPSPVWSGTTVTTGWGSGEAGLWGWNTRLERGSSDSSSLLALIFLDMSELEIRPLLRIYSQWMLWPDHPNIFSFSPHNNQWRKKPAVQLHADPIMRVWESLCQF